MIVIPMLKDGKTIYRYIDGFEVPMELKKFLKGDKLEWDYTYVMSDDPEIYREGRKQEEIIDLILDEGEVRPAD